MTNRSTSDELGDMAKMVVGGPGRREVARVEKVVAAHADNVDLRVQAGVIRLFAEELRLADLRTAKIAVELIEARGIIARVEGPNHRDIQACNNCHFVGRAVNGHGEVDVFDNSPKTVDVCRRNPPTARVVGRGADEAAQSLFPVVSFGGWCGS